MRSQKVDGVCYCDPDSAEAKKLAVHAMEVLSEREYREVGLRRIIGGRFVRGASRVYFLRMKGTDKKFYEAKVSLDRDQNMDLLLIRPSVDPHFNDIPLWN